MGSAASECVLIMETARWVGQAGKPTWRSVRMTGRSHRLVEVMNRVLQLVRAAPLTTFAILACGFGWMFRIAAVLRGETGADQFPLGPIIAAAIVAGCLGRAGLTDWWRRLKTARTHPVWWIIAILGPIVLTTGAVLVNVALGAPRPTGTQLAGWPTLPGELVGIFIAIGIGEEAGWTAFATPQLLARHRFATTFAIIAAIRVFWHLPLMLDGSLPPVIGVVANAGFQFMVLWLYCRSGGVWWLAAVWHSFQNVVGGSFLFRMAEGADQARLGTLLAVVYWLAVAVVVLLDRRWFSRQGGRPGLANVAPAPLSPTP